MTTTTATRIIVVSRPRASTVSAACLREGPQLVFLQMMPFSSLHMILTVPGAVSRSGPPARAIALPIVGHLSVKVQFRPLPRESF